MVTRIGGLASGMDIDALVEKLMNAERAPLNKLTQKKQTYEWQRDAYRGVNTKLKTFDTYIADNLVLKTLNSKTATSSNSNLVSATATGKATGTLSIEGVSQLATNARAVGNQISAVGSTKMSAIPGNATGTFELKAIQADGSMAKEATKIEITADMTVNQFVSKVNASNAGVNAVFENGRFSFTAKNSGDNKSGEEIQITAGKDIVQKLGFFEGADTPQKLDAAKFQTIDGKNAIFQVNGIATERTTNSFSISGYNVTLKDTFNAEKTNVEKYNAALKEWQNTTNSAFTTQLTDAETLKNSTASAYTTAQTAYNDAKNTLFGESIQKQEAFNELGSLFINGLTTNEKNLILNVQDPLNPKTLDDFNTQIEAWKNSSNEVEKNLGEKLSPLNDSQKTNLFNLSAEELQGFTDQANYNTLGLSFLGDLTSQEQTLLANNGTAFTKDSLNSQITTWKESTIQVEKDLAKKLEVLNDTQKETLVGLNSTALTNLSNLGKAEVDMQKALQEKNSKDSEYNNLVDRQAKAKVEFEDALGQPIPTDDFGDVKLTELQSSTGKPVPTSSASPVTMTSTTNVDEMMTKIKEFVTTYNGLIKDLNDQTKETKYRDYAPLTAEQKKDMEENEIKLWEEKAKSGLLRNDSLVRNGLSNLRSLIYQSNPGLEGSKYNTLFNVGITTSKSYNDGGTLEIDDEKLRKAIEEDPDAVERLFKNAEGKKEDVIDGKTVDTRGYLDKLRDSMKSLEINIEKKAGRSTMTDAQYAIGKSLMDNEKRIDTWQNKLKNIEARYWKQFTAMETAINKANQQSSMFMQG